MTLLRQASRPGQANHAGTTEFLNPQWVADPTHPTVKAAGRAVFGTSQPQAQIEVACQGLPTLPPPVTAVR